MSTKKTCCQNWWVLVCLPIAGYIALIVANIVLRSRAWALAPKISELTDEITSNKDSWLFMSKNTTLVTLGITAILAYLVINCLASYWIRGKAGQSNAPEELSADALLHWAATALFGLFSAITDVEGKWRVSIWMLLAGGSMVQIPIRWLFHDRYGTRGTLVLLLISCALFFWVLVWGFVAAQTDANAKAKIEHNNDRGATP